MYTLSLLMGSHPYRQTDYFRQGSEIPKHTKAHLSAPQMYEWSLLILHTLLVASEEQDSISIATSKSWGSVLDQFLPCGCVQGTAWLSTYEHGGCQHEPRSASQGKIQSSVSGGQGSSIPGPRNICWFAKNTQMYRQKGFLPGTFISRKIHTSCFGKQNMPQDYTEPDLNKSKFLCQAHLSCSQLRRSEQLWLPSLPSGQSPPEHHWAAVTAARTLRSQTWLNCSSSWRAPDWASQQWTGFDHP